MPDTDPAAPNLDGLVAQLVEGLTDPSKLKRLERTIANAIATGNVNADSAIFLAQRELVQDAAWVMEKAENVVGLFVKPLAILMVTHLLGIEATDELLTKGLTGGEGGSVGRAITDVFWAGLQPKNQNIEPSDENALRFMAMVSQLTVNNWYEGLIAEETIEAIPALAGAKAFTELANDLIDHLGINRLMRVALRPIVHSTIATPLEWKTNKTFRTTLLGTGEALRQFTRGRWSREQLFEELARAGYSDDRIEALIAAGVKTISLDDALVLLRAGKWTQNEVVELLKWQGYEEDSARVIVATAAEKRLQSIRDDSLGAIRSSYVKREISDFEFSKFLEAVIYDPAERAAYEVAAQTSRELNISTLSHGEVKDAVEAGIIAFKDYRSWLDRAGYIPDDQLTLELLLRKKLDAKTDIEKHRADVAAERAADKAAKQAIADDKRAQVEAERALHRRGSLADLNRAVVRGLIPIARFTEVLNAQYDPDTVAILVGLVEGDRQTYLAQQELAAQAKQRAARRTIDVGAIEQAVMEEVLSVDDYRARLASLGFEQADINILGDTLAAKLADRQLAQKNRAAADLAAANRSIDLGRFEQLVRKGVRTLQQYDALLDSMNFDDAARAGMVELLQLKIADDNAAADIRRQHAAAGAGGDLTLDQFRRAVLLGLKKPEEFQTFLTTQKLTADAQALLMAELRDDLAQADAARARRAATDGAVGSRALPLATVRRAVQLGVITPDAYELRLIEAGYSSDDVAIEMEMLLTEIASVQAARARRDELNAQADDKGLSLSQVERAVKANVSTLDDYRARAAGLGYSVNDVFTLTNTLQQELDVQADAQARHDVIAAETKTKTLSLGQLDQSVMAGLLTLDDYAANVTKMGYGDDDAELLVSLLSTKLAAKQPAA